MSKACSIFVCEMPALFGLLEAFCQSGESWIFRGQANASWKLSSSLERTVARYARQQNRRIDFLMVEGDIVEMGQRILKARTGTANCIDDEMDLLAYIQHYGGVTRLLDFSDSFAVALFFAVEKADSEFATVWCLNRGAVNGFSGNREERRKAAVCALVTKQEREGVISFAPRLLNERMIAQQGLFLMPLSGRRELQQSLFDGLDLGLQDIQTLEFPCEKDLQQKLFGMHCAMNEDACALSCSQRFYELPRRRLHLQSRSCSQGSIVVRRGQTGQGSCGLISHTICS